MVAAFGLGGVMHKHKFSNGFKWLLVLGVIGALAGAMFLVKLILQVVPDTGVLVIVVIGGLLTFRAWYRRRHTRS